MNGLALRIAGDTTALDRAMKRASDIVASQGQKMISTTAAIGKAMDSNLALKGVVYATKNSTALTSALKGVGLALATVAVGIGIIKGLEAATAAAAEQVERIAKIGDAARGAGVSNSFYQMWGAQARFLKVETEDLTKSLEQLKKVATVSQGEGQEGKARNESPLTARLRQQVEAGNLRQADLTRYLGASDTEQRLRVLLDLMQQLQTKGRDLAAIDLGKQFLTPALVEGVRNGSIEIDRLKQRLDSLNTDNVKIFEDRDIENAREMKRRLDDAYRIISSELKPIYEDFASAGRDFYSSTVSWVESLAGGVKLLAQAYQIMKNIAAATATTPGMTAGNAAANSTAGRAGARVGAIIGGKDVPTYASPEEALAARLGATDPKAVAALRDIANRMNPTGTANAQAQSRSMTEGMFRDRTAPIITAPKAGSGGSSDTDRTTSVERFVAALERARDVAKAEADTAGLSAEAREKAVALARAQAAAQADVREGLRDSVNLTDAERARIEAAAAATAKWKTEAENVRDALEFAKGLAGDALKGFIGDLREGKSAAEALKNTLDRISTKMIDKLIDGMVNGMFGGSGGGGGNIFGVIGKAFGFDDGGFTGRGGKYEPAGIVHKGEYVFSAAAVKKLGLRARPERVERLGRS